MDTSSWSFKDTAVMRDTRTPAEWRDIDLEATDVSGRSYICDTW